MPRHEPTWGFRIRPLEFLHVARRLRDDPHDVALGARLFFSVGGHDEGPTWRRLQRSPIEAQLGARRASYPVLFSDYEALRALPADTLGREYVRQLDEREIHPLELARLTEPAYEGKVFSPEHAWVRDRVRSAHDLYHTLAGYGIDVIGEAGVLAFTFGQTGNKGWAMLVLLNHLTALTVGRFNGWGVAWRGFRRGRAARNLAGVDDWDRLLRLPVEAARAELGISPPEPYRGLQLDDIFGRFAERAG